jgi:NADH:ubiquinone oxidoreductase subunit 4 (subunit M)
MSAITSIISILLVLMINLQKTAKSAQKFIDYKIGIAGAMVMGGIVLGINYFSTHEISGSITAAIKQGTYTFIFGGTLMKACEYLATNVKNREMAIMASIVIPSVFTLFLTYGMHNLKGTPKPIESTIPTLIIIPATAIWGIRKRKQINRKLP